ncbi:MAG: hypothetical protein IKZ47_06850 [Clostridia bacterium]|nr:hypothetical protein [Clostridia bacterium]
MKKTLSVLLSAVLIVMGFSLLVPVYAQDAPVVAVSEQTAKNGDTVDITVTLNNSPEIASVKLAVDFDSDLSLNSVTYGDALGAGMTQQPQTLSGTVILNWLDLTPISGGILFATLSFTVDEYAAPGLKSVTVTYDPEDLCDIDENNVYFDVANGGVSVICDHEYTSTVEAVASTCCTQGHAAYTYCIICDEILSGSNEPLPLDPANHEGGTILNNAKAASCTKAGYTGDTCCFGCGAVLTAGETIPMLAHTVGDWITDGENHWHHCSSCGQNVDVAAHSGGTATCCSRAVCEICGAEYGELDPDNHTGGTELRNERPISMTEAGYTGDLCCLGCDAVLEPGEEFFVPGDANLDGELDVTDLIRLKKHLIDSSVEISVFADISGNGIILPNDLEYMRALIIGAEYTVAEPGKE